MRVFTEDPDERDEYDRKGWVVLECEGGWMCFEYVDEAET